MSSVKPNAEGKWSVLVPDVPKPYTALAVNLEIVSTPRHGALYKLWKKTFVDHWKAHNNTSTVGFLGCVSTDVVRLCKTRFIATLRCRIE